MQDHVIEILGTVIFAIAVIHTFMVKKILDLSHHFPKDSGRAAFFHLAGEIEVVFGLWAAVFMVIFAVMRGPNAVLEYQESLHFTEPIFVFVIMVIAATKPVMFAAKKIIQSISHVLAKVTRIAPVYADFFVIMTLGPLAGSFITEPAAMTVTALLLNSLLKDANKKLMYPLLAVLFVNVSIGGALTSFAAPPILMVAGKWEWTTSYVFTHFGWKSAVAVFINSLAMVFLLKNVIRSSAQSLSEASNGSEEMPWGVVIIHYLFLVAVIFSAHHPNTAMGVFLLFMGVTTVTKKYQEALRLREALLVAFFLGGIIMFGKFQSWWLSPLLASMNEYALYFAATALTAVTDNAALTYLGAQVEGLSESSKYYLVAGAIAGGGLTVIANAPNAAGLSILQKRFPEGLNPGRLILIALLPTLVAVLVLGFFPSW